MGIIALTDKMQMRFTAMDVPDNSIIEAAVAVRGRGAELGYALAQTPALFASLERYFGEPYPYEKLDLVVLFVGASDAVRWMHLHQPEVWPQESFPPIDSIYGEHPEGPFGWKPRATALKRIAALWKRRL